MNELALLYCHIMCCEFVEFVMLNTWCYSLTCLSKSQGCAYLWLKIPQNFCCHNIYLICDGFSCSTKPRVLIKYILNISSHVRIALQSDRYWPDTHIKLLAPYSYNISTNPQITKETGEECCWWPVAHIGPLGSAIIMLMWWAGYCISETPQCNV